MGKLKVAVIGTTGFVGKAITSELINRDHNVTGISRKVSKSEKSNLNYIESDVMDAKRLAEVLSG